MNKETVRFIERSYYEKNNFKIIDFQNKGNTCFVFCSSNGIYSGKTDEQIHDFVTNNHFEWENISKSKPIVSLVKRIIFIKDPFQHSYVDGINNKIDSINEIIDFLNKNTKDMCVYTIGNSGGGYLALIIGSLLKNVKRTYSFGGIFSLYDWTGSDNNFTFDDCTFLTKQNDSEKIQYYSIISLLSTSESKNIKLHFYSLYNKPDLKQATIARNAKINNLFLLGFNSKKHGVTVNSFDYPNLLMISDKKLKKLLSACGKKQIINRNSFSLSLNGPFKFIFFQIKRFVRRTFRLLGKKR